MNTRLRNTVGHKIIVLSVVGLALAALAVGIAVVFWPADSDSPAQEPDGAWFTDVTVEWGIKPPSEPWPDGRTNVLEVSCGGVAVLDYDNDGDLDIYHVRHSPPDEWPKFLDTPAPNRLYQQQGDGTFADVTEQSGLGDAGFGHGVAVGDVDNDGHIDVFVTNFGQDRLYRNNGDGTFQDITQQSGIKGDPWTTSAGFLDYDRDGFLDLYIARFARFDPEKKCEGNDGKPDYCIPHLYDGARDSLYRNNGDGTFTDASQQAGIGVPARGWGMVSGDFNGDGWPDVYVANDAEANQFWINRGDGTFVDDALRRGAALSGAGAAEASMGVAAGDLDNDGALELFMTHFAREKNTMYDMAGETMFSDASAASGLAAPSLPMTGWGCAFLDFDHDGDLDLAVANGTVHRHEVQPGAALGPFWNRYAEPCQLYENDGQGRFTDVSGKAGTFGRRPDIHRGLAVGDLDGDGDLDMVVATIGNGLWIYRNDAPRPDTHWLIVRAMTGKRDAQGASVTVVAGGRRITRRADPAYGFLSSHDPRAHFGLGATGKIDAVEVLWPDGTRERFPGDSANRVITVTQGEGVLISASTPSSPNAEPAAAPLETVAALKKQEIEVAKKLTDDFPDSADAIGLLGMVYQAHGNTAQALKCWEKCLELNPNLADVYDHMGRVALQAGEHEKAATLWRKSLQAAPRIPGVHNRLARALLNLGKPKEAIAVLKKGIEVFPKQSQGYYLLGEAFLQLNEHEKAKTCYQRAVAIRADHTQAYYGLATVCMRLGQRDKAREHMAKFKNLKDRHHNADRDREDNYDDLQVTRRSLAQTHTDAAGVYARRRNAPKAEEHWQKAAVLDPKNTVCRMQLAALYRSTAREREALSMCEQLREIDPNNAVTHLNIGILHAQLKEYDAALRAVERAIELEPDNAQFGQVYQSIKKGQ